eukprot:7107849-Ditylum_brightwellii.AAC.1
MEKEDKPIGPMEPGTWVANAFFYNQTDKAPKWYEPAYNGLPKKYKVHLEHLLDVGFDVHAYQYGT